jgi:hypothetical protein
MDKIKSEYILALEGFEKITNEEMIELVISGREIVLTSRGDQLYWRPQWPNTHDTDVQTGT